MCYMGVFTEGESLIPTTGDTIVRQEKEGGEFREYTLLHIVPGAIGYTMTLWDNQSHQITTVIGATFAEIVH